MTKIVVFCGSSQGFHSVYKEAAITLGNYFSKQQITLVYGGGKIGLMGILADTILAKKGDVIGVIPKLLEKEEVLHANVEEMIVCKNMSERKVLMSKLADGYITLPGGFGTIDELFEVLTLNQLNVEQKPIGLLNTNGFFNPLLAQLNTMVAEGFLKESNKKMLLVGNTVEELMQKMHNYKTPITNSVINKIVE